jgi:hypothetical protein
MRVLLVAIALAMSVKVSVPLATKLVFTAPVAQPPVESEVAAVGGISAKA